MMILQLKSEGLILVMINPDILLFLAHVWIHGFSVLCEMIKSDKLECKRMLIIKAYTRMMCVNGYKTSVSEQRLKVRSSSFDVLSRPEHGWSKIFDI